MILAPARNPFKLIRSSAKSRTWIRRAALGAIVLATLAGLGSQLPPLHFWTFLLALAALASPVLLLREIARHNAKIRRIESYAKAKRSERSDHLDPNFHAVRSALLQSSQAYWNALAAQKFKTASHRKSQASPGLDPSQDQPPGARNYIIKPKDAEAYWLRCNRHIEANRYCQRVHPNGYEIALWDDDLHAGMKLVDLIGQS